jgi:hypothetical protein
LFFFFLEKKEAKIQGSETMAKNYSFRSARANSPARVVCGCCVLGSNNTRLLSATQKDAPQRNFFNAILSRPAFWLRLVNYPKIHLMIPDFLTSQ